MSYLIGVDGGGTKTECILIDAAGRMVAGHVGVGCNPSIVGLESAASIVTAALHSLRAQAATHFAQAHGRAADPATLVTRTLLCMAGHRDFWRELAAGLTGFGRVATSDDSLPVLELATAGRPASRFSATPVRSCTGVGQVMPLSARCSISPRKKGRSDAATRFS